jgi:hypothetical protein
MAERIMPKYSGRCPRTGRLYFFFESELSEEKRVAFLQVWNYQRQKAESTLEPLGEATIIGNQLIIKPSMLNSETWQFILALEIMAHLLTLRLW